MLIQAAASAAAFLSALLARDIFIFFLYSLQASTSLFPSHHEKTHPHANEVQRTYPIWQQNLQQRQSWNKLENLSSCDKPIVKLYCNL